MYAVRARRVLAVLLAMGALIGVAPAAWAQTPPDGSVCQGYLTVNASSSTVTFHAWATDCGSGHVIDLYWQFQRGTTVLGSGTLQCHTFSTADTCAANGVTKSYSNPSGTQFWQGGGTATFYSPLTLQATSHYNYTGNLYA